MNLFAKQKYRLRCREQMYGCQGGRGSGMNWVIEIDIYDSDLVTTSCPTLVILWTVTHQTSLPMGFPRQEY